MPWHMMAVAHYSWLQQSMHWQVRHAWLKQFNVTTFPLHWCQCWGQCISYADVGNQQELAQISTDMGAQWELGDNTATISQTMPETQWQNTSCVFRWWKILLFVPVVPVLVCQIQLVSYLWSLYLHSLFSSDMFYSLFKVASVTNDVKGASFQISKVLVPVRSTIFSVKKHGTGSKLGNGTRTVPATVQWKRGLWLWVVQNFGKFSSNGFQKNLMRLVLDS